MSENLLFYLIVSVCICVVGLCLSALAYLDGDRKGTRYCLVGTSLSWAWAIAIPAAVLYGIWKMIRFAFPRKSYD